LVLTCKVYIRFWGSPAEKWADFERVIASRLEYSKPTGKKYEGYPTFPPPKFGPKLSNSATFHFNTLNPIAVPASAISGDLQSVFLQDSQTTTVVD
jgi:hypothetical protein